LAVVFRTPTNTGNDADSGSRSPAVPTGASAGDIVVVVLSRWTNSTAITAPADFADWGTTYGAGTGGPSNANLHIFWKRLTGADTGTYTFSWTGGGSFDSFTHAHCFCASGCVTAGNPIEGVNAWAGTAGTFGATSLSTVTAPGLIWSTYNDSSGTHTPPTSGSWTEVIDFDSGSAAQLVPGTSGTQTASGGTVSSSSAAAAVLIALKADTGGVTTSDPLRREKQTRLGALLQM